MKPRFALLKQNFPTHDVSRETVLTEIGWNDLIANPGYADTCAIRMSLALIKSGLKLPGRMAIKTGTYKGALIEPGQARLSKMLTRQSLLGSPERFKSGDAAIKGIKKRQGIASFFRLYADIGDTQGHIDIISPWGEALQCGGACYWRSGEV
ncbi:hypothetical protein E4L96_04925 [Massilia arenosa]|uniref:Type VI secretion system (T6SS), amidase effector protein 4 n=1 Tax=Zemynaea arenosa TaxID=2561931 RepID=A0A4Y9SJ33_9BURK|nr:T6SS effector amidase Tae4 family protein [Massilia arenosa]TFW25794.1 hypothetical protein E4L96_04925 [Massilia arenosa]